MGFFGVFGVLDEGDGITNFSFNVGTVAILFDGIAAEDGGGALILTEGFTDVAVATTEDPINDFALGHRVKIVGSEVFFSDHGFDDVADELKSGTSFVAVVVGEEW